MIQPSATCRRCGAALNPSETQGLCPVCLMETGLGTENGAEPKASVDTAWLERNKVVPAPVVITESTHRFGDYELYEEIGRGGMGVIYRAKQLSLDRIVAVKTILTGPLASPDFVQRFHTEAHAAAVLDHPNIVPIYEVGDHQGQPFYSMRLIAGRNLAQALKQGGPLPPRQAATLIGTIARAIHYAHQRGVLHRDLKPANMLLDTEGSPHVTDFGLAKLLEEDDGLTLTQAALGTPNYMAPEQASGKVADLTIAADTYSLGAILFETLTGEKLFASATPLATINRALDQEPPRPSTILRLIPRDLDTICAKCLEKAPHRRYATAQALAEDLERWLAGEPILARRVGAVERLVLWCHRKPAMARLAGAALLAVFIAVGIATWRVAVARKQKELEQYSGNISLADAYIRDGGIDRALDLLLQCPPKLRHWEWGRLLYMCHQEVATIAAHTNQTRFLMQSLIRGLKVNRDGTRIVTHGTDGQLKLWEPFQLNPLLVQGDSTNSVVAWDFSPNGQQLAVGMRDGKVQILDVKTGKEVWSIGGAPRGHSETLIPNSSPDPKRIIGIAYDARQDMPIFDPASEPPEAAIALCYAPDGRRIASATGKGFITVRDAATGRELAAWRHSLSRIEALWFTPDGELLVAKDRLDLEQFESESGKTRGIRRWESNEYASLFVDWSGRNAATVSHDQKVQLWRDGEKTYSLGRIGARAEVEVYQGLFFDPGGRYLCIVGEAGKARLHEVATGRLMFSIPHNVFGAAFSSDASRLVTFGPERLVRLWDIPRQQELRVLRGHLSVPDRATFSADGNFIATASRDGMVKLWTGTAGRERIQCESWPSSPAYSPDGAKWAVALWANGAYVCGADSGKVTAAFPSHRLLERVAAFSADGHFLITAGCEKIARIWDLRERRPAAELRGHDRSVGAAAFSPDGRWIATGDAGGEVRIWDAVTWRELRHFKAQPEFVWCVAFDPSGRKLVTGGFGPPKVWDVETGRLLWTLDEEGGGSFWATFSPDGRRIISACLDHQIRLWDANSGRLVERWTSRSQGGAIWSHSPDGRRLVVCVSDMGSGGLGAPSIEIWDTAHGRRLLDLQGHTDNLYGCIFSPDGRRIISSSMDNTVRQWETFPWQETEFAALPGKTLPDRILRYAEWYWQERLAAERAVSVAGDAVPLGAEKWETTPEWEKVVPPVRATTTSANLLNLDGHYTDVLDRIFHPTGAEYELDDDLRQVPTGEHTLGGIPFDVRGVIVLRGGIQAKGYKPLWQHHPVRAEGIPVGSKARRIHVLHAAVGEVVTSTEIGSYVLHYADGTQHELEIVYGRDLRDWWHGGRGDPTTEVTQAQVAWTGSNPVADSYSASLRLFLRTYDNPRPDVRIVSIDFVSKLTAAAPFLVAMTVEP